MNVIIKSAVAAYNIDAYNRTVVCEEEIENGSVFELLTYSDDLDTEEMVWKATKPAKIKGLWMATSPEVVVTKGYDGTEYRGITPDPRAFINIAGKMIDATFLVPGDIIEMTADGIDGADTSDYLVASAGSFVLTSASAAVDGLSLKKIGTSQLHIGQGGIAKTPIPTYKYVVEAN